MKELWFEAYEGLCNEMDREPTDAEVEVAYQDRIERLLDAADFQRAQQRGAGL